MADKDTEKITIRAFKGDKEKLSAFFPAIGYNKAMRHIIHSFIKGVEEKARSRQPVTVIPTTEISIEAIQEAAKKDESE